MKGDDCKPNTPENNCSEKTTRVKRKSLKGGSVEVNQAGGKAVSRKRTSLKGNCPTVTKKSSRKRKSLKGECPTVTKKSSRKRKSLKGKAIKPIKPIKPLKPKAHPKKTKMRGGGDLAATVNQAVDNEMIEQKK